MLQTVSTVLVVTCFTGLALYDVLPFLSPEKGDTISEVVQAFARRNIVIAWICSVLIGHWFLPRPAPLIEQPGAAYLLIWVTWMIFLVGLFLHSRSLGIQHPVVATLIVLAGLTAGHLLWSLPSV